MNSGCYGVCYRLDKAALVTVGKLGRKRFPKGYYVYVGSAKVNLEARVSRHQRREKKLRWHIDYFSGAALAQKAWCFLSARDLECSLADFVSARADEQFSGFGCSDCNCRSHLFRFHSSRNRAQTLTAFAQKLKVDERWTRLGR